MALEPLRSQLFQACHLHSMATHRWVVRTAALINRPLYWLKVQEHVETWCKRCTPCRRFKTTVRGHSELQQPRHGAFKERVSVDLIGPLHRSERVCVWGGGGWIRFIVGFQPLMVISPTASWIRFGGVWRCMRVSWCGPVLFGPNDLRPTVFRCHATDSIPPQVSRKESLRLFILTPSCPVGCLTH